MNQIKDLMEKLKSAPPIKTVLDAFAAFVLIGQIQLALRHPQNTGPSAEIARHFVDMLIARLAELDPRL